MTVRRIAAALLVSLVAGGAAFAQDKPAAPEASPPAAQPEHGAGASGKGDGSGMGQDTSEIGTPKGPGDKGGPPADTTVAPKICDDGRQPVEGACPN